MANTNGLKRSLADFKRHPWLHLMSVTTIALALLIIGVFFLGYRNFQVAADMNDSHINGTVYLSSGILPDQLKELRDQILALENVQSVNYKEEKAILEDLGEFIGEGQALALPDGKLFPNIFEVEVSRDADPLAINTLKTIVGNSPFVTDIDFSDAWFSQFRRMASTLKIMGLLTIMAILIGCSFIIANFMGMRLQTRKEEIDIVRLMGADKAYILVPFLWEGLIEGILGSALAIISLFGLKFIIAAFYTNHWANFFGLETLHFLSPFQVFGVLMIGIVMAFLGSITIFLRVREAS